MPGAGQVHRATLLCRSPIPPPPRTFFFWPASRGTAGDRKSEAGIEPGSGPVSSCGPEAWSVSPPAAGLMAPPSLLPHPAGALGSWRLQVQDWRERRGGKRRWGAAQRRGTRRCHAGGAWTAASWVLTPALPFSSWMTAGRPSHPSSDFLAHKS